MPAPAQSSPVSAQTDGCGDPGAPVAPGFGEQAAGSFGERLAARVRARESQIVLGLDPDPMALWPGVHAPAAGSAAQRAAGAVAVHCRALIDAAGPACVAVKPQLARFEALGAPGWDALRAVVEHARAAGLLVIADGKRGDIDVTARAYATALMGSLPTPFGEIEGLGVDMATVNPLLGADAIEPFVAVARAAGAGVLLLVRTSNPGGADVQDAELAGGGLVWERLARLVDALGVDERERGSLGDQRGGLADVGAVIGATEPAHLVRARELMPRAVFLLPGVGAQGGRVEDLAPAFAPGRAGGLIAASRSIAAAHEAAGGDPASAARAEAERLRELAWSVSS
ncbi:MAG TPA: orotidine-5'-phosphate decarboxylase [Solirubrobacteraceae bacterium]|nr:orotidine-5'-phosphate decarboxylase [Solirubrobacteraceae bacterium]